MKKIQFKLKATHMSAKQEIIDKLNNLNGISCKVLHEISDGSCILEIIVNTSDDENIFLLGILVGTIQSKHITLNS